MVIKYWISFVPESCWWAGPCDWHVCGTTDESQLWPYWWVPFLIILLILIILIILLCCCCWMRRNRGDEYPGMIHSILKCWRFWECVQHGVGLYTNCMCSCSLWHFWHTYQHVLCCIIYFQWMRKSERLIVTRRKNSPTADFTTTSDSQYKSSEFLISIYS